MFITLSLAKTCIHKYKCVNDADVRSVLSFADSRVR